jgi:hypothetical protein
MPLEGFDNAKNLGGRPQAEIDLEVVRNAAGIGCTVNEIAAVLGVCRSTLFKYMQINPDVQTAIDEGRDKGCATLRRHQWQRASVGSDTMLIWLGKQMLGQRDTQQVQNLDENGMPAKSEQVFRWKREDE